MAAVHRRRQALADVREAGHALYEGVTCGLLSAATAAAPCSKQHSTSWDMLGEEQQGVPKKRFKMATTENAEYGKAQPLLAFVECCFAAVALSKTHTKEPWRACGAFESVVHFRADPKCAWCVWFCNIATAAHLHSPFAGMVPPHLRSLKTGLGGSGILQPSWL